jgi:hypothetical protein
MGSIVVDAATRDLLLSGGEVEVRDETGAVVCRVTKAKEKWPAPPPGYVIDGEWPSDEELDRIRTEPGYSVEQVMDRLRRLRDAG